VDRLRDAVLDQHAPGVAGDQSGVTGLEVVGDQGGTKTLEVANKVASAYKDLAIEIQRTEAGTEWDEASFFAVLEQDNGPEVAATARRIYEWSQQHMPSIWWGKVASRADSSRASITTGSGTSSLKCGPTDTSRFSSST